MSETPKLDIVERLRGVADQLDLDAEVARKDRASDAHMPEIDAATVREAAAEIERLRALTSRDDVLEVIARHRRHIELSPGVGIDVQCYGIAVCDDIANDIRALKSKEKSNDQ